MPQQHITRTLREQLAWPNAITYQETQLTCGYQVFLMYRTLKTTSPRNEALVGLEKKNPQQQNKYI